MRAETGSVTKTAILLIAAIAVAAVLTISFLRPDSPAPLPAASQPATQPTSQPTTKPAAPPAVAKWIDVVRRNVATVATTQPLMLPLNLNEAARLLIDDPLYLCPRGDLWITRADAPPTSAALKTALNDQIHVVRDRVLFVLWSVNDAGAVLPVIVTSENGALLRITLSERRKLSLSRKYQWSRAFVWNNRVVAPTEDGVAIVDLLNDREEHFSLCNSGTASATEIRILLDRRGILAWAVDGGAARFVDEKWSPLGREQGWSSQIVELLPLLDGTVIQVVRQDEPTAEVRNATPGESTIKPEQKLTRGTELRRVVLDPAEVDEAAVTKLVAQLSSDESEQREAASAELSRYGAGIWPILEKLRPIQPAEGQLRLEELLSAKDEPTLGVMRPVENDLRPIAYLPDGGVVLYADSGVEVPRGGGEARIVAPAWLAIRPGRSVKLLPPALVDDALPDQFRITAWGDDWIVIDEFAGPQRFLGNHLSPLLNEELKTYSRFIGIDSRGRWLLRTPESETPTLVIDPFIPDPTPRLPVWNLVVDGGIVGWDENDWPVQRLGGAWALKEEKWEALPEDAAVITALTEGPTTAPEDVLLLEEKDGTRWYDGGTHLRRVRNGQRIDWELPPETIGTMAPTLVRAGENRLFLFNSPGRVLRIREEPDGHRFTIEATFTDNIPFTDEPQRIWRDPAGRLVIAYQENKIALMFPDGRIPPEIAKMMPGEE